MKEYYTYAYLREDRTPYYIGKGSGNRVYKKKKGEVYPPKDKSRIIFLKLNLTEEEAFKHEKYMIAIFGRKNLGTGILHNKTDGGEGQSGLIHSEKSKKKMSESHKGKIVWNKGLIGAQRHNKETRKKMSESRRGNKSRTGQKQSEEEKKKKSEALKKYYAKRRAQGYKR